MKESAIIYDNSCPLCCWYTGIFIRKGWLKKNGRVGFENLNLHDIPNIDLEKARHYIPYYDADLEKVFYGPEALLHVLGPTYPILKRLYKIPLLRKSAQALYKLISYNRRVIAGQSAPSFGFDCAPDFHAGWRLKYIVFATLLSVLILPIVLKWIPLALATGLLLTRIASKNKEKVMHLSGHLMTVSIILSTVAAISWPIHPILCMIAIATTGVLEIRRRKKAMTEF